MPDPNSLLILRPIISLSLILFGIVRPLYCVIGYMLFVYLDVSLHFQTFADWQSELVLGILVVTRCLLSPGAWKRLDPRLNRTSLYFLGFTFSVFLSFVVAWDWGKSWDNGVYHYIKSLFVAVPLFLVIEKREDIVTFLAGMVGLYVLAVYEPLFNFIEGGPASRQIYGDVYTASAGLLSGHVAMANNLNQMIPIALSLLLYVRRPLLKIIAASCAALFLICLVITRSRGGTVGFLFMLALYVIVSKRRGRTLIYLSIVLVLLSLGTGLYYDIFAETLGRIDSFNTEGRLIRFIHGIEMVRAGNILGVGPGCYYLASGSMFGFTMEAHNIYGEVIGDLGIPGTLFWALLIWSILRNLIKTKRALAASTEERDRLFIYVVNGMLISLSVRLFVSMGSHGLYIFYWYVFAALAVAGWQLHPDSQCAVAAREAQGVELEASFS